VCVCVCVCVCVTHTGTIQAVVDSKEFAGLEQVADAIDYMYAGNTPRVKMARIMLVNRLVCVNYTSSGLLLQARTPARWWCG